MPIHIPHKCQKLSLRSDGTPWFSEFPEPASTPTKILPSEVYSLLEARDAPDQERPHTFLLIDTRRADCVGGTIKGSINLPAHSFYWSRKMLFDLCRQAGVGRVVFYCGSSNGRGPRCAAWMQDYIDAVEGDIRSEVMVGGIRGWVKAYGGRMMEGYDEKVWLAGKPDEV
ncbi:hypothetical protein QBC42DRAFT_262064 [Cladorrhinum samala]|uniref:Rhodanese domain-containing protein n=1 Tax=Cladorrhinum samala TaxID=585594 RepID=A0AAV9HY32_9PEZI|nr:hypothetical protein QBC42DRAFT_262064 [Cladorrhinum samala]